MVGWISTLLTWCVQGIGKWESNSLILFDSDKFCNIVSDHGEIALEVSKIKDMQQQYTPSRYFILNFNKRYCRYADFLFQGLPLAMPEITFTVWPEPI